MSIILKSTNNKWWKGCGEKWTPLNCWWECKLMQTHRKIVQWLLKKLKMELLYDPAIPLLNIYLDKTIIPKDTCTPLFITTLFTIAKIWKQPKYLLTSEWIKKMWGVCVCVCLCVCWKTTQQLKKKKKTIICSKMDDT